MGYEGHGCLDPQERLCCCRQPYVRSRPDGADLVDLVAQSAAAEAEADGGAMAANGAGDGRPAKRQRIYADHWPLSRIEDGIKRGALHQVSAQYGVHANAACPWHDDPFT